TPNGNQGPPPALRGAPPLAMFVHELVSILPDTSAAMKKKARTASESTVIVTVKRMVASIPMMLTPTKITEKTSHQNARPFDQAPAESAGAESKVPSVVLARDDGADPQRPERPHPGMASQAARLEVFLPYLLVGDGTDLAFRHASLLLPPQVSRAVSSHIGAL